MSLTNITKWEHQEHSCRLVTTVHLTPRPDMYKAMFDDVVQYFHYERTIKQPINETFADRHLF